MTSYKHTSTILRVDTDDDEWFFDDNEQGMAEALKWFNELVDEGMRRHPDQTCLETIRVVRLRATGLIKSRSERVGVEAEEIESGDPDDRSYKHSRYKNNPCFVWWNRYPNVRYEVESCDHCS